MGGGGRKLGLKNSKISSGNKTLALALEKKTTPLCPLLFTFTHFQTVSVQQLVSKIPNTIPIPQLPPPQAPCVTTHQDSFPAKHCFCIFPVATSIPSNPPDVYVAPTTLLNSTQLQIAISPRSPDLSLFSHIPQKIFPQGLLAMMGQFQ